MISKVLKEKVSFIDYLVSLPHYLKLLKKYNSLEGKYEVLKDGVESQLLDSFLIQINNPVEIERLRKDNKRLRTQVHNLKDIIRGDK